MSKLRITQHELFIDDESVPQLRVSKIDVKCSLSHKPEAILYCFFDEIELVDCDIYITEE